MGKIQRQAGPLILVGLRSADDKQHFEKEKIMAEPMGSEGYFPPQWQPAGISLPADGIADEESLAAVLRINGGNFRLLDRLLTQIARVLEINELDRVTVAVVNAARESLVIGTE